MRTRPFAILISAALLSALPHAAASATPSAATSTKTFRFYGSGWGHGIGMSQYGAYGLAQRGWSHQRILRHFYRGTSIGRAPWAPRKLRVGVAQGVRRMHLRAAGGPVELRVGKPTRSGKLVGKIPAGYTWTISGWGGHFRVLNAKGRLVGVYGGPKLNLYIRILRGSRVFVAEAGYTYDLGHVELNVYRACSGCGHNLRAIVVVGPQQYLYGVAEVSSSWPMEAMKAQADAARSYAFYTARVAGQHRAGCNCALFANTIDQAYHGYSKEHEGPGWLRAVDETARQVVLYGGATILANYYASSGGYTENNENVWGSSPIPYLRAVCDPGDYTPANPVRTWTEEMTGSHAGEHLARYGYDVGAVTRVSHIKRSSSGRIISLVVHGTGGSDGTAVRISGPRFSGALGLMDDKVWINVNKNIVGAIRDRYDALMCRPGLPRTPRRQVDGGLAQRFAHGGIYVNARHDDLVVWVHGFVFGAYMRVNGPYGVLGLPTTAAVDLESPAICRKTGFVCTKMQFDRGRVYYKEGRGAHELHGAVLSFYLKQGGAPGTLGFPTSDVERTSTGGSRATFERGTVVCSESGSCRRV